MSYNDNSDIIDILKKEDDDDDIQVINRDDYPFDFDSNSNDINNIKPNSNTAAAMDSSGLTPILSSLEDPFESQLVSQPKLYSNLPPLQPLSEPVLPNNINLHPLSIDAEPANSNSQNPKKRKESPSVPKTRPAFVMKIWSMVNDPLNNEYIRWDDDGKTFQVFHREEFMKNILPKYFKHNNFASFVRQLNMYGWHKVQDISNGTLKDEKNGEENWKFENPNFQKDREDLLDNIVRNRSVNNDESSDKVPNFKLILNELDGIKMNQMAISEDLRRIRKDNNTLWQENYMARERHVKQTQTLDKILKFLATVYGNNNAGKILEVDHDQINNNNSVGTPLNLDSLDDQFNFDESPPKSQTKPRLMLMDQAYKSNKTTPNSEVPDNISASITSPSDNDLLNGLEHNIYKQGQLIQQVQDWVHKLSNQQQLHQQQLQQVNNNHPSPQIDLDFDVNDFLHNSNANTPQYEEDQPKKKKFKTSNIEEIND